MPTARLLDPALVEGLIAFRRRVRAVAGDPGVRLELVLKVDLPESRLSVLGESLCQVFERRESIPVDRVWIWGQLADRARVYLNTHTAEAVFKGWHRLLDRLDARDWTPEGLFFDIEPDLEVLQRVSDLDLRGLWRLLNADGVREHRRRELRVASMLTELRERVDAPVLAASVPTAWLGPWGRRFERALGAPMLDAAGLSIWPEVTAMVYTSFMLPWLGGPSPLALRLAARAGRLLSRTHVESMAARGALGSAICGTCAIGALGDEPCYPSPESMASLLGEVASAGPAALSIFNLWGVISGRSSPVEGFEVDLERVEAWAAAVGRALNQ